MEKDQNSNKPVYMYVTQSEKVLIENMAKLESRSVSSLCLNAVMEYMKQKGILNAVGEITEEYKTLLGKE